MNQKILLSAPADEPTVEEKYQALKALFASVLEAAQEHEITISAAERRRAEQQEVMVQCKELPDGAILITRSITQ